MNRKIRLFFVLTITGALVSCMDKAAVTDDRLFSDGFSHTSKSAKTWFEELDKEGYGKVRTIGTYRKNVDEKGIKAFIDEKSKYGKNIKRELSFLGFWTGKALLAVKDYGMGDLENLEIENEGITQVDSKLFSLIRNDYFKPYADKQYIFYVFDSSFENVDGIKEILVLWKNWNKWEVAIYNIGEDI